MQKAIIETIKEAARVAFFAAIAALVLWLQDKAGSDPTTLQFVIYTAIGRLLDKLVHENDNIPANGIAPF